MGLLPLVLLILAHSSSYKLRAGRRYEFQARLRADRRLTPDDIAEVQFRLQQGGGRENVRWFSEPAIMSWEQHEPRDRTESLPLSWSYRLRSGLFVWIDLYNIVDLSPNV